MFVSDYRFFSKARQMHSCKKKKLEFKDLKMHPGAGRGKGGLGGENKFGKAEIGFFLTRSPAICQLAQAASFFREAIVQKIPEFYEILS